MSLQFRHLPVRILMLPISLWLGSCASIQSLDKNQNSTALDSDDHDPNSPVEIDPTLNDTLEEDFCYDDLYTSYLRNRFLREQAASKSKPVKRSRRRARMSSEELAATFHARRVLVGPVNPYFGALPVVSNEKVEQWVRYFKTEGRPAFIKWLVRAKSFSSVVAPVLAKEGLPPELFFLAMIESGFSNTASSSKRATGTWQFMKATAELYNLKINYWVDERRDPVKSTVAAARYLRDLYAIFGDWYLAMAAYNAGPGKVRSAIRRSKSNDFWKIAKTSYLRPETKHYVPKMLAALVLSHSAAQHGFDIKEDPSLSLPTDVVLIDRPIALDELSTLLNVPLSTLRYWNPELVKNITPPGKNKVYQLRLRSDLIENFAQVKSRLAEIEVTDVVVHKIKKGETLGAIAKRYGVSVSKIINLNPKINPRGLRIGHEIAVPIPGIITKKSAKSNMG